MENISRSRIAFSPPGSAITIVLVGVIVVATLYFAREVLVPIALALLLSFVLAPLVQLLRRWYLPHSGAAEWVKSAYHKWIELQGIPILLVDLPQARRCKFKQMPVGIPKIDTAPAARPYGLTFDDDIGCAEALFPLGQLRRVDREGYVQWTTTVVRRNGTAAHFYRLKRSAALEEQEHAAISRSESAHSVIGK